MVALGKFFVCRPNLADGARRVPTHISISEKLKEFVDKGESLWVAPDQESP